MQPRHETVLPVVVWRQRHGWASDDRSEKGEADRRRVEWARTTDVPAQSCTSVVGDSSARAKRHLGASLARESRIGAHQR